MLSLNHPMPTQQAFLHLPDHDVKQWASTQPLARQNHAGQDGTAKSMRKPIGGLFFGARVLEKYRLDGVYQASGAVRR